MACPAVANNHARPPLWARALSWLLTITSLLPTTSAVRLRPPLQLVVAAANGGADSPPTSSAACLDAAGQPVPWWLHYKLPGDCDSGGTWVRGNVSLYVDAHSVGRCRGNGGSDCWSLSSIDAPGSALQRTLSQLNGTGTGQLLYNDLPPVHDFKYWHYLRWAHAKGLLHFNATAGIWLRHSIPSWPNQTAAESWSTVPLHQTCLGQHVLCLSLDAAVLDGAVAGVLSKMKPFFYQAALPDELRTAYPGLAELLAEAGQPAAKPGAPSAAAFATAGGSTVWRAFAKANHGPEAEAQLFEASVVPGLGVSMGWQTWRTQFGAYGADKCRYNPRNSMNATCGIAPGGWDSANVQDLAVPAAASSTAAALLAAAGGAATPAPLQELVPPVLAWRSCDDHSKWGAALPLGSKSSGGVSSSSSSSDRGSSSSSSSSGGIAGPASPWVCFCDNNRAWSQLPRGGACTCTESVPLWQAMAALVQRAPDTCGEAAGCSSAGVLSCIEHWLSGATRFFKRLPAPPSCCISA
ncbi:hypothetical protein D9Q98_000051 [Chlorella vulgaris]|uniref:Uncharacterized protein n=1 Tax=Chlorella vulgaris TaxID=3077 RepID=A0A9D4TXG2_CHLVU|nr:hypothetical protein D9Q98_000051 [Chlorella vulgaris]